MVFSLIVLLVLLLATPVVAGDTQSALLMDHELYLCPPISPAFASYHAKAWSNTYPVPIWFKSISVSHWTTGRYGGGVTVWPYGDVHQALNYPVPRYEAGMSVISETTMIPGDGFMLPPGGHFLIVYFCGDGPPNIGNTIVIGKFSVGAP